MSKVFLRDFLYQLTICSEKAACIARHIRFMNHDFDNMIQEKLCNRICHGRFPKNDWILFCLLLVDENHQHLDADYKTLA